jgi:hypothetical protein
MRVETDQHSQRPVPADQRQAKGGALGIGRPSPILREVGGEELGPLGNHPVGHRPDRMFDLGRHPLVGEDVRFTGGIGDHHRPAGRGNPFLGLSHQPDADFLGIKGRVRLADGIDHRVAPLEAGTQRTKPYFDPAGKVGTADPPDHAAGGVRLSGNWSHRSEGGGALGHGVCGAVFNSARLKSLGTSANIPQQGAGTRWNPLKRCKMEGLTRGFFG